MHEEFNKTYHSYVVRDDRQQVREVFHKQQPYTPEQPTPQLVAQSYLREHRDLFEFQAEALDNLGLSPAKEPVDAPVEYRFTDEKKMMDLTTVAYAQTCLGIPVWGAGVAVQVRHDPYRVTSSSSTAHQEIEVKKPSASKIKKFRNVTPKNLTKWLNLGGDNMEYDHESLQVRRSRFVIYRYDTGERLPAAEKRMDLTHVSENVSHPHPRLPLSPPDDKLKDGNHYVGVEVIFSLNIEPWGLLNWIVIVDVQTESVLYLRAFTDNVSGLVFDRDPMTATGDSGNGPGANASILNPLRSSVSLPDLDSPSDGQQSLKGAYIEIKDFEKADAEPPTEPTGDDFDYGSRTNDFAAVNAYFHCNNFFRLVADLGFTISDYFGGTSFPIPVDHRGKFGSTDGIERNASCNGNGTGGIANVDFELADLGDTTNPIGIASDWRVVLHELGGHGILYDHVNSANFGFAHSAGDSFAAILNDPDSQASDRFETFPWIGIGRRHDRDVAAGWGWGGTNDVGGYSSEQILCTSHFRIYRSIGGDAGRVATQRFAARFMAYLMLRAIGTLTQSTNPSNVSGYVNALQTADLANWTSKGHAGGAYGKVIRWSFEKQGLFQPPGASTPVTTAGEPPAVDVYIEDGRHGEYQYQANHWSCQNIWNRLSGDGGTTHEQPVVGETNYAYVKIKNRGTETATNVRVKGYHCIPSSGLVWPGDWQPMATAELTAENISPNNSEEIVVGPFEWVPSQPDHECMLMIVSADGDPSNVDHFSSGDSIPEWRLVPHDNNIGQRNVHPVPGGGGIRELIAAFNPRRFWVRNPFHKTAGIEVEVTLPDVLRRRGWELQFHNPGGSNFTLEPGQSRELVMKWKPGTEFTAEDVRRQNQRTIHIESYADDILIGGMSYELDPNLKSMPSPWPGKPPRHCRGRAKEMLDCLDLPVDKVRSVRIRKITVDIEVENRGEC